MKRKQSDYENIKDEAVRKASELLQLLSDEVNGSTIVARRIKIHDRGIEEAAGVWKDSAQDVPGKGDWLEAGQLIKVGAGSVSGNNRKEKWGTSHFGWQELRTASKDLRTTRQD